MFRSAGGLSLRHDYVSIWCSRVSDRTSIGNSLSVGQCPIPGPGLAHAMFRLFGLQLLIKPRARPCRPSREHHAELVPQLRFAGGLDDHNGNSSGMVTEESGAPFLWWVSLAGLVGVCFGRGRLGKVAGLSTTVPSSFQAPARPSAPMRWPGASGRNVDSTGRRIPLRHLPLASSLEVVFRRAPFACRPRDFFAGETKYLGYLPTYLVSLVHGPSQHAISVRRRAGRGEKSAPRGLRPGGARGMCTECDLQQ